MKNSENFKWDKWQQEVLAHHGNVAIHSGRQCGKSVVIAEKAIRFAMENEGTVTLVIAAAQRQSGLLFEKIRGGLIAREGEDVFAEKPTLTKIVLKNGSRIYCFPAGKTGYFIMGYTVDLLIADEAAYVAEPVWNSILPMIMVSRKTRGFGFIWLLSIPFMKGGFFYESCCDSSFKVWNPSSEDCPRISVEFLTKEKKRLSKEEYARIYQGKFVDEYRQFFKSDLLARQSTFIEWNRNEKWQGSSFYLGVDFARYGGDENAFVIVEMRGTKGKQQLRVIYCDVTDMVATTDTIGRIIDLNYHYDFKRIFVDDGGLGGGIIDILIEKLGRKVVGLNNASKGLKIHDAEKRIKILKEDLYSNALVLLENGKLELISNLKLLRSLKSITTQYTSESKVRIYGKDTHLAEAMVRACWCIRDKGLGIYLY